MGISGTDADAYAQQVVIADFEEPGDADVLRKVLGDLIDKGIATDEHKVRHEMTRLLEEAEMQVSGAKQFTIRERRFLQVANNPVVFAYWTMTCEIHAINTAGTRPRQHP